MTSVLVSHPSSKFETYLRRYANGRFSVMMVPKGDQKALNSKEMAHRLKPFKFMKPTQVEAPSTEDKMRIIMVSKEEAKALCPVAYYQLTH